MKVTYLYHSGFLLELEEHVLLFDYYKGKIPEFDHSKKLYVFASHKHKDHFNMELFDLFSDYEEVSFFLGSDVKLSENYLDRHHVDQRVRNRITTVRKNSSLTIEELQIRTLRSTDAGVAFLVEIEGKSIYHGGDLNWWHWEEESEAYNRKMAADYQREIDKISGEKFHIAFVPLDPRQGESYHLGMDYFLEKVEADVVFPMHMWDTYDWILKYKAENKTGKADTLMLIQYPGEEFKLWNM